ncbi:4'-phosphopantetheinyl transferase family protein [Rhizorhapis suberifaciens]|uniref:Phosphopantetheine--protein transferase-like protein n=1 Tax=Rhizorhapis suberifaciens TaxID=13656 RepID=A0A840HT31_9SPHN|nr:4'-phosphopantetheinyl transferase superfamily protein [Rhizorhapis suberifaciens]MBB4640664.1 phosphopantetheine--protein transferase-like protein [Rhizorhapis suberifaciens]
MTASPFVPLLQDATEDWLVYGASYNALESEEPNPRALLSAAEIARADRFVFEPDRRRFILAHAYLRRIVEIHTRLPAATLLLSTIENRRPELSSSENTPALHLSLSHCRSHVAVAISERRCVGVDIESISSDQGAREIAENFFSAKERQVLSNLRPDQYDEAFMRLWTAKEAFSKALGLGLALPLDSLVVQDDGRRAEIGFSPHDVHPTFKVAHINVEDICICAVVGLSHDVVETARAAHDVQL